MGRSALGSGRENREPENMTNRWVVGVDGSPGSQAALDWAAAHAAPRGAGVAAVRVYHQPAASRVLEAVGHRGGHEPNAAANARHELDASIGGVDESAPLERVVIDGSPGKSLIVAAEDAALLIVGRHGAPSSWQRALGSVSRYCAIHSPVPMVVVPTDWEHRLTERIVVGFDGSDNASAALQWAFAFAEPTTSITAVIALEVAPWLRSDIIEERLADELRAEESRLRALIDAVDPDSRAHRDVVVRGARPALARAAEHADLVVLGAHGAGRVATALMGSVSTWMLDASSRPTVIVPLAA